MNEEPDDEIIDDDESAVTCEFEALNMIEATKRHFGEIKPYSKPGIYKGELVYLPPDIAELNKRKQYESRMRRDYESRVTRRNR